MNPESALPGTVPESIALHRPAVGRAKAADVTVQTPGPRDHAASTPRGGVPAAGGAASRLDALLAPDSGDGAAVFGFRLVKELGRGAFARVFLARQGDLADRYVVLKVSTDTRRESKALAQLQHTNIVPVHSVHTSADFQAICMPYFGSVTLADVYRELEGMPTLPNSGRGLVSTLNTRRAATLLEQLSGTPPGGEPAAAGPPGPVPALTVLEGLSYVEAVLWLAARLADGLAHAHDRGVVHRDIKPANILVTDEGQPMLLDFNLSAAAPAADDAPPARGGGTPPYMAPEQLSAFIGSPSRVDARSDLYALGVVVFELLTRNHPFPRHRGTNPVVVRQMLADRQGPPPRLRPFNRLVSPAVEAIVRRCLETDPDKRYQSARELKEDVERHLENKPLRHTPEPSARERVGKWRRRHPYLASSWGVAAAAVVLAGLLVGGYAYRGDRLARMDAADAYRRFTADVQTAQVLLLDRQAGPDQLAAGMEVCEAALARYGVLDNPDWRDGPAVARLPDGARERLTADVGEVLFLLAKATARRATLDAGREDPQPRLKRALAMNDAARACFAGEPRAVWEQRAELTRLLGQPDEAREALHKAADVPLRGSRDRFLLAHLYAAQGQPRKALPLLREATRDDPQNFVAWFVRGTCHLELQQEAEAVGCFNACVALRPDYHWAWYNRGLAARRLRHLEPARADFDRVVVLRPGFAPGYMNRAVARHGLGDFAGAVEDFTTALGLGGPATSIYFLRAEARRKAGDAAGADRDTAAGMRRPPADEDGYIDRGLARVKADDRDGALADFDAALRLNPQSFRGLQNKAALLADKFRDDAGSLAVIDEAVRLYPDSVQARAGRGVLLARAGKADPAVEDAKAALALDAGPATLYRAACVYALVSKSRPEDRPRALQLLAAALRQGYGHHHIETDPDLDPLRDAPEFRPLLEAAKSLRGAK
jgi:serine/threonine protein kinase/tetratricopeptide (TPR) repeat protein